MEQTGKPSWVHISQECKDQLDGYCSVRDGTPLFYQSRQIQTYYLNDVEERGRAVLDAIVQERETVMALTPKTLVEPSATTDETKAIKRSKLFSGFRLKRHRKPKDNETDGKKAKDSVEANNINYSAVFAPATAQKIWREMTLKLHPFWLAFEGEQETE